MGLDQFMSAATKTCTAIPDSEAKVWVGRLDGSVAEIVLEAKKTIHENEQFRASLLRVGRSHDAFVLRRAWVRWVLARELGVASEALMLATDRRGKPRVQVFGRPDMIGVSWARCGPHVLLACQAGAEIGIDAEIDDHQLFDEIALATQLFDPREVALISENPAGLRRKAFLDLWCRKEAVLKAVGLGVRFGMRRPCFNEIGRGLVETTFRGRCIQIIRIETTEADASYLAAVIPAQKQSPKNCLAL
jgi:4'-phosphopantetheinyl transferase